MNVYGHKITFRCILKEGNSIFENKLMDRLIVIRKGPMNVGKELLKTSIMSYVNDAFINFLFKEIILQMMVLLSALSFIFLGLPVGWCLGIVPLIALLVYISTYSYHAAKALQILTIEPICCWIAEVYEPYIMTADPQDFKYNIINESDLIEENNDNKGLRKKVIGIVMIRKYLGHHNKLWMYGLSVDNRYQRRGIGKMLIKNVCDYTNDKGYDGVEFVITDLQNEARLFFLETGFKLKNIYHKRILGFVPFGMYQMGISTISHHLD